MGYKKNRQMRNLYKNILLAGMFALWVVGFSACEDDEIYDFPGDEYNRVYMLDKSTEYKVVQTPISTISSVDFETFLKCTQKASENIKATVEVDNSLIDAFNKENETSYEAMPSSVIQIENATMTIPEGAMAAIDTLRLKLTDDETALEEVNSKNGYLIPLRITTAEGGESKVSTNFYTTYLIVTVTEDNVNHDASESDITGTLVSDQSGWSATTNGTTYSWSSPVNAIFDGNKSTYCYIRDSGEDLCLDINMGKQYTFDAFTFYYGYSWSSYEYGSLTSGMTIYTSDDGINWKSAGEITSSSKICVFYAPVTTQFIRIVNPYTGYTKIKGGIFNVYEK